MSSEELKQQILAALKKLGPSAPRAIADDINTDPGKCSYQLREMLHAGELKAGGTSNDRVYALPEQKIEGTKSAPPQRRKKSKGNGKRAEPKPSAARPRPAIGNPQFLAAITEDYRMVIVQDGELRSIHTIEQTQAIADLLLTHFEV